MMRTSIPLPAPLLPSQILRSRFRRHVDACLIVVLVCSLSLPPAALAQSDARGTDASSRGTDASSSSSWPSRRASSGTDRTPARGPTSIDTAPTPEEVRARLTRNPVRMVSTGKPLNDLQAAIESALGVRLILTAGAGSLPVNGEITGDDGMGFLRELAARVRLEWAIGPEGVFMAPEGSGRATGFTAASPEVASRAAAMANQEFESLGSGVRVVARKEDISVTGIPAWVNQVAALRMPRIIDLAERTMPKDDRASTRDKPQAPVSEPLSLMVFRLSNAFVDDKRMQVGNYVMIIPGVATLFRQFTGLGGGGAEPAAPARGGNVTRVPRLDPLLGSRGYRREDIEREVERRDGERRDSERSGQQEAQRGPRSDEPVVIADSRMNTLIVRDRASMLEAYRSLVKVLDQTAEMVQLDAFIIDIKASRLDEFGIGLNWSGSGRMNASLLPGGTIPGGANLILQGVRGAQLLAQIRALESQGDSEILTVPSVVTLNNLEATFSARESFFVKIAGNLDASLSEVTAETLLKVTPLLTHQQSPSGNGTNRRIRLLISVQDGSVDGSASAVVDNLPRTRTNQISTQALVRGGDTLVIGGQVVRKRAQNAAGLPVIRNIPLLGALTTSRSDQTEQYVRLYVVRPRILGDGLIPLDEQIAEDRTDPLVNGVVGRVPAMIRGSGLSPRGLDADRPASTGATTESHFVVPLPSPEAQRTAPAEGANPTAPSPSPSPSPAVPAPAAPAPAAPAPAAPAPAAPAPGTSAPNRPDRHALAAQPSVARETAPVAPAMTTAVVPIAASTDATAASNAQEAPVAAATPLTTPASPTPTQATPEPALAASAPAVGSSAPVASDTGPAGATAEAGPSAATPEADASTTIAGQAPVVDTPAADKPDVPAPPSQADPVTAVASLRPQGGAAFGAREAYFVPVGIFANADNARALQARLDEMGIRIHADPLRGDAGELTRLRAGPFASRTAAERVRSRLDELGRSLSFKPGPVLPNEKRG